MPHVLCALLNNARLRGRLNACCLRGCAVAQLYWTLIILLFLLSFVLLFLNGWCPRVETLGP